MRITTSKSKNSESFYINYAFIDKNGKSTSKTFKKLGTLAELSEELNTDRDGVMTWAKEQARIATEIYKKENETISVPFAPNRTIDKNSQRSFNCGYLFLQSIYSDLRFDNIFRNIKARHDYEYNLDSILSDLIYSRILKPSSKKSSYLFAQSLLEQPKYQLHDLYRALSVLAQESDYIQSEVYRNSNFIHKRNTKVLYYDCTNYYFEIEQEDGNKKYGKSKENRPNPIIGMGLFMDADGFPLAFDLHPGNQNEQMTLKPLEQKVIRDFDCSEFIYCSDSGLASKNNKLFNSTNGRNFVITQSLKKLKKEDREIALNSTQYRKIGCNQFIDLKSLDESDPEVYQSIYYKEIPLDSKIANETLIVTYSPKYKAYQAKIREGQIERAIKMVEEKGKLKKTHRNPNDPARFITSIATTEYGEVADKEYKTLNQEAIDKEAIYDGFYGVTTNLDCDIAEIIAINKRRWQIEECFRIMKTDFEARPIYLQREDRIKAHFLVCFLSLLIYRLLESKLENEYTVESTLTALRDMNVCSIDGYGYIPTYKRTDLTDKLHDLFDFRTDTQIIKKSKMRNIIQKTKER
ncbi:MAG: IS1634 family transposase [Erysipelotrichaceae bacterium]